MDYMEKRLEEMEKEIKKMKEMLKNGNKKQKPVSFRGMAKTKLSDKELDEEIRKAKKSLFKHASD